MNDKTKEYILKTLLVICMVMLFLLFPGCFLLILVIRDGETLTTVYYTILFTCFGSGILFMILAPLFGGLKQPPVKADKFPLAFCSYDDLLNQLRESLLQNGYREQSSSPEVTLYVKPVWLSTLECFAIIRVAELSDELLNTMNDRITEILTEYYRGKRITDTVNMISVICVDRITPAFRKLLNSPAQQGLKNGRLPVGVSFGGKIVYVAKQTDGFAIGKYKRMRKQLFSLMNLSDSAKEQPDLPQKHPDNT